MMAAKAKEPAKAKAEASGQKAKQQPASGQSQGFNPIWHQLALGGQAKLAVSAPDDPSEREADAVADRVMRMAEPSVQRTSTGRDGLEKLQRKESGGTAGTPAPAPPVVHQALSTAGQPLDRATREFFEPRFGHDFGSVRVHADRQASQAAGGVAARAFTVGRDIVFGSGQYAPGTEPGRRLLAHELSHVVQQGREPRQRGLLLRQPSVLPQVRARQEARAKLEALSPPDSFTYLLAWLGGDPLQGHLTTSIQAAVAPTLGQLSALEAPWRAAIKDLQRFQLRARVWDEIRSGVGRTDDPSLLGAARALGDAAYDLCGPRWTTLLQVVNRTVTFASGKGGQWDGLSTLMPWPNRMLRRLGSDLRTFLGPMSGDPSVLQSVRTVLGFPASVASNAAVANLVDSIYQQNDDRVRGLGHAASNIETAKFDTSSFTKLGAQASVATSLNTNLKQVIDLISKPEGLISQRDKLAKAFRPIHSQVGTIRDALRPPETMLTYAFNNFGDVLSSFAGAAEGVSLTSYEWLKEAGKGFELAISKQEPQLLETADATLGRFDVWCGLVAETLAEADTLDEEAPTVPSWWQIFLLWNWKETKEAFVEWLKAKVPLLKELIKEADELWRLAASAFERFKERVFKEGRILAPLWEFFLSVIAIKTPPEFVRDVAERTASLLGKVLKHPIRFLKGLAGAVKLGLKNFGLNIGNHVLSGILDWLFDQFDLPLPATFGGIVKALAGKVGLEVGYICERIAVYLGKRGYRTTGPAVEKRLRQAIDAGAVTFRWFRYLIKGEFGLLWEEIKGYLARFWQWIIDKAVDYFTTTLKDAFFKFLARLADPTGLMAALQFIKAIYDAFQTIKTYLQKLLDLVREVFRAIRDIAAGKIDGAAAWIESGAAKLLSVLMAFVARHLNLDSVVKLLHQGLGWVKENIVTPALDTLIKVAGDIWDWLFEKAQQALEWWRNRGKFRDHEGNDRSLTYEPTKDGVELHVSAPETKGTASVARTPEPLEYYLPGIPAPTKREREIKGEISNMAAQIGKVKKDTGGGFGSANGELIHTLFNEIVVLLGQLGGKGMKPPPTDVKFDEKTILGDKHGKKMEAKILSTNPGDNIGSAPTSSDTALWKAVQPWRSGGSSYYIKGHLLNHNLHGPGTWKNMTPIARTTNANMETKAEGPVKQAVLGENKVVRYLVEMIYGKHKSKPKSDEEGELPSRVKMEAEELTYKKGKWVGSGVMVVKPLDIDNDIR